MKRQRLRYVFAYVFLILTVGSLIAGLLWINNHEYFKHNQPQQGLTATKPVREVVETISPPRRTAPPESAIAPEPTPEVAPEPTPEPLVLLPLSEENLAINPDYYGWIHIPDTKGWWRGRLYPEVDYPVVQIQHVDCVHTYCVFNNCDTEDCDHSECDHSDCDHSRCSNADWQNPYLHKNFRGKSSRAGTIYASNCTDNPVVLFGHHMKNGGMFAVLERYKQPDFRENHRTIYFSTLSEEKEYYVIAVYYFIKDEDLNRDGVANYYDTYGVGNLPGFLEFLETYDGTYFIDRGIDASSSQFLALQVCTYRDKVGQRVDREDENIKARLVILAIEQEKEPLLKCNGETAGLIKFSGF